MTMLMFTQVMDILFMMFLMDMSVFMVFLSLPASCSPENVKDKAGNCSDQDLYPRIFRITGSSTDSEIKIGSISSEVDKKTAIKVPTEITPPA